MNKQELYKYLDENKSDYYMVTWNGHTEPLFFMHYQNSYFPSPLEIRRYPMTEEKLLEYVHEQYSSDYWDYGFELEKKNLVNGYWYEIDCPQCSPFLPDEIDTICCISEEEVLQDVVRKWQ